MSDAADNGSPKVDLKHAFLMRTIEPTQIITKLEDGTTGVSLVWICTAMRPGGSLKYSKLVLIFAPGAETDLQRLLMLNPEPEDDVEIG